MTSIMGVQRTATARNQRAERVSLYLLTRFSSLIGESVPVPQAHFSSSIAQDIWDNKLDLSDGNSHFEIWSQTTCYKGHANPSRPEPNKGYEFRETITELLSLLADHPKPEQVRTVHITYGNHRYAYVWMHDFKGLVFDSSVVINLKNADVHEAIEGAIGPILIESEAFKKLDAERASQTPLGVVLDEALNKLSAWMSGGMKPSKMGRELAEVVAGNAVSSGSQTSLAEIQTSIKGRIVQILLGNAAEPFDPVLEKAAEEFLEIKPFLRAAHAYLEDWDQFRVDLEQLPDGPLANFIHAGWQSSSPHLRPVFRRLLVRTGHVGDVNYVQDINVDGITEHNLYGGEHSEQQALQIADIILPRLAGVEIELGNELLDSMVLGGRATLGVLVDYEIRNGTNAGHAKSVVHKEVCSWGFTVVESPAREGRPALGFHVKALSEIVVGQMESKPQQFNNFSLIVGADREPLAYLKVKYFRKQEFERRAKEEAFVGLTLTTSWEDGGAILNGDAIPVIMYVDTDDDPSSEKVKRSLSKLRAFGWDTCLSPEELRSTLTDLQDRQVK